LRVILIIIGFILLFLQKYILPGKEQYEIIVFFAGIILLGIPHGAADLLVAAQNARYNKKLFSIYSFFVNYLGRLFLFALIIWLLPWMGILLFIFFAAYHFGETDLHHFSSSSLGGKLFIFSYGLVILSVLLLNNYDEVIKILQVYSNTSEITDIFLWIGKLRYSLLTCIVVFFLISTFFYFVTANRQDGSRDSFLLQFMLIVVILFNLPLLQGFTFYFVIWHSLLSLRNIVTYLKTLHAYSGLAIFKQILLYSVLAIAGISMVAIMGYMWSSESAMVICTFIGLAVLTAPHMQIMYEMYNNIRTAR
jgi:beta-carotene 15,15'-dioxygenase